MFALAAPIIEFMATHPWLSTALASGAYGLYKSATHKQASPEDIAKITAAIPPRRQVQQDPLQTMLGNVFMSLSEDIRKNADKLSTHDLNNIFKVIDHFTQPLLSTYAQSQGLSGALTRAKIKSYNTNAKAKAATLSLLPQPSANQQMVNQYFPTPDQALDPTANPYLVR